MRVRDRLATIAKVFGSRTPADMAAGEQAAQMTPSNPFSPGQPIGPYDGYSRTPRSHNFVTGYNISARPKAHERVSFNTLRGMVDAYDVAQMCIWHRIDSIRALDWSLVPARGFSGDADALIDQGMAVLEKPDRQKRFKSWLATYLYDVLAYDAGALYRMRNRGGRAIGLRVVDGTTIAPLLDYWGNSPEPPTEAYVQYANGLPWGWLTRNDLIYEPFRPRSNSMYGTAPLESILLNANTDLRFQQYFLQRFTDGNIPQAFASAPETWTPDQIEQFQALWDAVMMGDQSAKSQIRWIPGGSSFEWSNEKEFSDSFSLFLMRKTCLDEKTEILTQRGWVKFPDLLDTDDVATRSAEGEFEWQRPTDYIAEPYSGDMVQFKSNSLDLLVTPDHRMLLTYFPTKKHPQPKEFIRTAGEIVGKGGYMIPMRSRWEGESPEIFVLPGLSYEVPNRGGESTHTVTKPDVAIPMRTWVAFLGLWLAEGHVDGAAGGKRTPGHGRGLTHRVGISQMSQSPYFEEIQGLLNALPFRWTRSGHTWVCQDKRLHAYLAPLGNSHSKYIPADVKNLSAELLEILWSWACKGDGHHYLGKSWHMITSSKVLADDWQEVLQKCGRDASVSPRNANNGGVLRGKEVTGSGATWIIRERTSPLRTANGKLTSYEGMVYCVSVPNGVIYVRRNGRPAWVGNCAAYHVVPSDLGFTENVNRSSGETQADVQHRVGDLPLVNHIAGILTDFLKHDMGLPLEFTFDTGQEKEDRLALAQAWQIYIESGMASSDEGREQLLGLPGDPTRPTPRFFSTTRLGPVPLLAIEGVAGKVDPETFGPSADQPVLPQPFVPPPGVVPAAGTTDAKASEAAEDAYQVRVRHELHADAVASQAASTGGAVGGAPMAKDGATAAPTAGITTGTGLAGYDLAGRNADEDEEEKDAVPSGPGATPATLAKREATAFRRFRQARRRDGKWRDFEFRHTDPVTAHRLNDSGRLAVRKAAGEVAVAGLAVHAADTGRVLMLQRALDDTDPAAGCWEFPGGHLEGEETPLQGAWREWAEETGCIPPPGQQTGTWNSSNGIYRGIVWTVPDEAHVPIGGDRDISNPDDPDGDHIEAIAWWDPAQLVDNPAVRTELLDSLPDVLAALGGTPVAKAGEQRPKAGEGGQWPGWPLDLRAAAYWALRIAEALGSALGTAQAQQLAQDYASQHPAAASPDDSDDKDDRDGAIAAALVLLSAHVALAGPLAAVLAALYTDGYLIGAASAVAAVDGTAPDLGGWTPGDTTAARARIEALGAAAALTALTGTAATVAAGVAATRLRHLARILAEGVRRGDTPAAIAQALIAALTNPDAAHTVAGTETTRASSTAAQDTYRQHEIPLGQWVLDPSGPCPICAANAAAGPLPIGDPYPSGHVTPPVHPRCRCALLPA